MVLTVDIGNTRIKCAVFEGTSIIHSSNFTKDNFEKKIVALLESIPSITDLVVASVGDIDKNLILDFQKEIKIHFISNKDNFPYKNLYATPHTLGVDRMVLAAGATLQFPTQNRLVIDAGTCVTYDFIDESNNYHGGAISPGLRLRYEALHSFTAKLPLLDLTSPEDLIGNSTAESIHSGVVNGLVYEIDGAIEAYRERYSKFIIILTGGDTDFLAKRLKNTIFANSNFLLESLNQTFQYKINND